MKNTHALTPSLAGLALRRRIGTAAATLAMGVWAIQPTNATLCSIDDFTTSQYVQAVGTGGTGYNQVAAPEALGGYREIWAGSAGPGNTEVAVGGAYGAEAAFSVSWRTVGQALMTWDGDDDHSGVNPTGLGALNLSLPGGTRFLLGVNTASLATTDPVVQLSVQVFTPSGQAEVTQTVEAGFSGLVEFPFDEFVGADLSRVGAITLGMEALLPGLTLGVGCFATDSFLPVIPEPGSWLSGLALAMWLGVHRARRGRQV